MKTLYRATRIYTQSYPEMGEWLLIDGRHVQRVGSGDPPEADRLVELPGATLIPGFIDTHVHLTATGLALSNRDVEESKSAGELLDIARARAARSEDPVLLQGFDESRWEDPRHPSMDELDAACPQTPLVAFRVDGHVALANSRAIEAAELLQAPGLDRAGDGTPTGTVVGQAAQRLSRWSVRSLPDPRVQALQLEAAAMAASRGVTTVHEMQMPHSMGLRDLQVFLGHRGQLPVDAVPIVATMDLPLAIDHGFTSVGGDLPVDGSIGARTAALTSPYADRDQEGTLHHADDELAEFFHDGHMAGLQVGVHAIGDRAIEQVLGTWERVYMALDSRERRHFRARRHRIEHFEVAGPQHVERAAMLGLAVSVQPAFDLLWGGSGAMYERALGPERAASMNPFRTTMDRGVEVGVGSDAPVTPLDPMLALFALENHHEPSQRLSRREGIRLHTIGGARVGHQEAKKGALAPGMHADFAAFELDPFLVEDSRELRPTLTVSLGREVFVA